MCCLKLLTTTTVAILDINVNAVQPYSTCPSTAAAAAAAAAGLLLLINYRTEQHYAGTHTIVLRIQLSVPLGGHNPPLQNPRGYVRGLYVRQSCMKLSFKVGYV